MHAPLGRGCHGGVDHWESRARDPQLHTHVVIANRVQRATDGAWVTLDLGTLYRQPTPPANTKAACCYQLQASVGAVPGLPAAGRS
ncbi:relaxase domain-containing protein [Arthrobacter sp. A5]|uniref:relaxase domain-containing protein n=1 Tax=Arthrobacter sp. A5 TaxID=576926 RepID=UPI003DAA37EA